MPDARVPLWEKYIYLAPFAGFTGAARLPIGPLWAARGDARPVHPRLCRGRGRRACGRRAGDARRARARSRLRRRAAPTTRSSLLIDLQQGKRIEVEALQGALVRRARTHGIARCRSWRRCTPSCGTTRAVSARRRSIPPRTTSRMRVVAVMSASGFPSSSTRSASLPDSTVPARSAIPSRSAASAVAVFSAAAGVRPAATYSCSSRCRLAPGTTNCCGVSVPADHASADAHVARDEPLQHRQRLLEPAHRRPPSSRRAP